MNGVISGYRKMTGLTQKDMAKKLGISEGTYRNKENGRTCFKHNEMAIFYKTVNKHHPSITINDIFFNFEPTQKDASKEVVFK